MNKANLKIFFLAYLLATVGTTIMAQSQQPDWENPQVFAVNKEKTRATALPYPSEALALADNYAASPYYRLLDGMWKFYWVPKVAEVPIGFYLEDYNVSQWKEIPVPGNWEFNGYGTPFYVNYAYGIPRNPPYIDRNDSPTGAYRHQFDIPASWDGRRVFLHFEAGTNAMYVWVNGQKVGYTENAKSPAEFDITSYIRAGKNTLACEVHKFSDGYYLEDQDMWRLGGINRSVYLYSTAQTRIEDFFAHPELDSQYKNGSLTVEVKLKNYTASALASIAEVSLFDNTGQKIFTKSEKVSLAANASEDVTIAGAVKNPKKWTAETPNLYTLVVNLKDDKDNTVESTSHRVGFRRIEIKDGQVFINGKKIFFKGVNLHEFNTNAGNVVTRKEMIRNLELMKQLNINAVRTSHYPQSPLWYQLCDEYGIYLVDEANMESHGLGYGPSNVANFPEWEAAHMDRVVRLIERDKNHPSVIFWSLGNESGNGTAFFSMYDWAKKRDSSRPVQYEQAFNYRNTMQSARNSDVLAPMYPSWTSMTADAKQDLGRPYIMCEYAHAMGNSMGNFQEYWDVMRSSKNMQGGFIWEWYNHGYPARDEQGRFYWAYGGDLGGYNRKNNDNFCMDGIISPDQNLVPHSLIVKKVYQNILFESKAIETGIVTVINDFKFTDITPKNYAFRWLLLKNGKAVADGKFSTTVLADSRKEVKLDLPKIDAQAGDEYFLQIYADNLIATPLLSAGFEVAKEEFAFGSNNYFASKEQSGQVSMKEEGDKITLSSGTLTYVFNKTKGFENMLNGDEKVFNELPRLNFWRSPTDNDFGANMQKKLRLWESLDLRPQYSFVAIEQSAVGTRVQYECRFSGLEAVVAMTYTVNKDGSLTLDAQYKPLSDNLPEMMRFGMLMTLPKTLDDFTWYGRGPGESYIDRKHDAFMGVYNGKVAEQAFPYYRPQEAGNKSDVRWLTLTTPDGVGIRIEGAQPLSVSATNNRPEDSDPGRDKKQLHTSDVLPRNETVLCVDLFQRGVAGIDSWGAAPLEQYRFWGNKEHRYAFTIFVIE